MAGVIRYNGPFSCPSCGFALQVPQYYLYIGFYPGLATDLALCLAMHLERLGFVLGFIIFFFPSLFSVGILQRKLVPQKLHV
jgi:hypothetical protein